MSEPKNLKRLIWLYLVLLIFEGALRKWVFPGAADALLVVRDPVVLLIYVLAITGGFFPLNGFTLAIGGFTAASVAASFIAGQTNALVLMYGLRINYLHLPLIWVMGAALERRDVQRMGSFVLLAAIPMGLIMVEQFRSPMSAAINRGVGGSEIGQIFGADGRIRPPGLFAFITGPQLFLPLAAAFFFYQASVRRQLPWLVLVAAGLCIVIALPVSISRTVMLATGLVGVTFAGTLLFTSRRGGTLLRTGAIGLVMLLALSRLPIFEEGRAVFMMRWQTAATSSNGDAWENVYDRTFGGLLQPLNTMARAKFFGSGVGVGSNVGARLLSGKVGFLLAEDEWTKIVLELGPVLGGAFILFRIGLTVWLGLLGLRALFLEHDPLPILLFSACGAAVFIYQWGPPTLLGFAVFGAGLILAALKPEEVPVNAPLAPPEPEAEVAPVPAAALSQRPPATPKVGSLS
jgi:hypothetical protein